jgi:tetratricopeptide (TPR) repeat protein
MIRLDRLLRVLTYAALVNSAMTSVGFAQTPAIVGARDCGPMRQITYEGGGPLDYRYRNTDPRVQRGVSQITYFHIEPARREMSSNVTRQSIIADLDFVLRHSPNHIDALRLLIEYRRRGGQLYEFPSIDCAFVWAFEFAPDDMEVVQIAAQHYWKAGDIALAEELFAKALNAEPNAAELNYNVGLFYFARKDYERARRHARIAYAGGYPLPGLRSMLDRVHQWNDPAAAESAPAVSSSTSKKDN